MATQEQVRTESVAVLYNGDPARFKFHAEELVVRLREQAIQHFKIVTPPHLLGLFTLAGVELDDDVTLHAAGVQAGDELLLRQRIVQGG